MELFSPTASGSPRSAAASWLARDAAVIGRVYHRYNPVVIARGEGSHVYDVSGRAYLDFTSGIAVTNLGHCPPRVVAAAQAQLSQLIHVSATAHHELNIRLAEALTRITPPGLDSCFFANSGAEAVDGAVKLARRASGRTQVIAFEGAFHGRTLGATSLTTSKGFYREAYGPLVPAVHIAPYPRRPSEEERALAGLERLLSGIGKHDVAAIVVEPILGEGGYIVPPPDFLRALRDVADQHGILLIADEVQTGLGRTGRWWACEASGVVPDMVLTAKPLASGLPISAIVASEALMEAWPPSAHGSTFGGNPVCAAAALETLEVMADERLVCRADTTGRATLARLQHSLGGLAAVREVRGSGLMIGVEVQTVGGFQSAAAVQEAIREQCLARGLMLISCGSHDEVLRIIPPLNIDSQDLDQGLSILEEVISEIGA